MKVYDFVAEQNGEICKSTYYTNTKRNVKKEIEEFGCEVFKITDITANCLIDTDYLEEILNGSDFNDYERNIILKSIADENRKYK